MNSIRTLIVCIAALLSLTATFDLTAADEHDRDKSITVLSWNVSNNGHLKQPAKFRGLLSVARPEILLLDEVSPRTTATQLREVLDNAGENAAAKWYIDFGVSGGRQRGVIASTLPLEALPELQSDISYPDAELDHLRSMMPDKALQNPDYSMEDGIPVHGSMVLDGDRRLLAVTADLQCCGNPPDSWQEYRRRVETREIRRLIRRIVERTQVDAIILAGDFNLVSTAIPLIILSGPYPPPNAGLLPAELYHNDGASTWTWDGRGTPFPSRALDFQLYSPASLRMLSGFILDTENIAAEQLEAAGLTPDTFSGLSDHRPLVAEYAWQ